MKPVLCVGDVCVDLIIPYASALKAKNGEPIARAETEVQPCHGGSVANTATAIARLGVPVLFAGACGNDAHGRFLRDGLLSEGVDCSLLRMDDAMPSQSVLLVLDERGERTAFAYPARGGVQHAILPEQFPIDVTERIGWLHVNGMMLREDPAASTQLDLMRRCHEAGIPVSLDVNARIESKNNAAFHENLLQAKQFCTVIFGSAVDEIPLLTEQHDAETAALSLSQNGTVVIARSGAQGAVYYKNHPRIHSPAFPVTVIDTIGAGDTFDGAFIAACMRGLSPEDALREANAAAAVCVGSQSGRSCPTLKELHTFLTQHPLS
jgi:sugar/nucleoside kinase (ribokinase family)